MKKFKRSLLRSIFIGTIFGLFVACGHDEGNMSADNEVVTNGSATDNGHIQETIVASRIPLDTFVERYNMIVRDGVKTDVSVSNASNSDYIGAAKTLVVNSLRFPDTVEYKNATVTEKDSYGRAIVFLDYTAENALGMAIRSAGYFFINGCDASRGTFDYNMFDYRCESAEYIDLFKEANDFGVNPVDIAAEKYTINTDELVDNGKAPITKDITYDKKQIVLNCGTLDFYLDGQNVVATVFEASQYGKSEDIKLITDAVYSVQIGKAKLETSSDVSTFFDAEKKQPSHEEAMYLESGVLLQRQEQDTIIAYAMMPLDETQYALGDEQWKPLYNDGYFGALGDSFFVNGDYDAALWFYQEGNVKSDNYKTSAFKVAEGLENNKEYEKAIVLYKDALDLPETKERYEKCNYLQGDIYMSEKRYDEAVDAFYAAGNYADASEKLDDAIFARAVEEDGTDVMYDSHWETQWSRREDTMFLEVLINDDGYVELKMKGYFKSTTPGEGYKSAYVTLIGKYTKKNFSKLVLGDLYLGVPDESGIIVPTDIKYFDSGIIVTTTRDEKYGGSITSVSFSGMKDCICDTEPYMLIFEDGTEVFFLVYDDGETPGELPELKKATTIKGEFYIPGAGTKLNFNSDGTVELHVRVYEKGGWRNTSICCVGSYELISETEIKLGALYFDSSFYYDNYYSTSGIELVENKDLCLYNSGMRFSIVYEGYDFSMGDTWSGNLLDSDIYMNSDAVLNDKDGIKYYLSELDNETYFKGFKNVVVN